MTRRRNRRLALFFAALALGLLVGRLLCVQGLTTIVRIEGGSMAETLPGEHVEIVCPKCSRRGLCDAVQWEATSHRTCPQCGTSIDDAASVVRHPGTRVVIDRAAYWFAQPQRFDVVAFRQPREDGELAVKRIVALPGERWEIRGGDLFVDDQRVQKSYAQFRALASLAHEWDKAVRASDSAWQASNTEGLVFRHQSQHPGVGDREIPVQDDDPYNPALTRPLNEVADIIGQAKLHGDPQHLFLRVHDGYDELAIEFDEASGSVTVRNDDQEIKQAKVFGAVRDQRQIAWGVCDRQLFLVVNDVVAVRHPLEEKSEPPQPIARPLAIRDQGTNGLRLSSLQVLRDIYYLDPRGLEGDWKSDAVLRAGEYALLGDNPPLSIDSRHWDEAISRDKILGKVWRR